MGGSIMQKNRRKLERKYGVSLICLTIIMSMTLIVANQRLFINASIFTVLVLCSLYLTSLTMNEWIRYIIWTTIMFSIYISRNILGDKYEMICIIALIIGLIINIKQWRYYGIISTSAIIFSMGSVYYAMPYAIGGVAIVNILGPMFLKHKEK